MRKRKLDPAKSSKALGLKIRQIREGKGWTLEHCEEMGWPDWTHLQKLESGRNMTFHTLINLANLFGIHPSEFLKDL